jgi:hypothetical protein
MDALFDALVAKQSGTPGGLNGVRVNYGPALPDPGRESVNILGVEGEQVWAGLGKLAKDEVYTINVLVIVIREGQQSKAAVERAYAITSHLEDVLRDDPTLGDTCRVASLDSPFDLEVGASDTTRSALLTIGVRVEARI